MKTFKTRFLVTGASMVFLAALAHAQFGRISKPQYISLMNRALDEVSAAVRRGEARPVRGASVRSQGIDFSANLFFAHEAVIEHIDQETLLKQVDAFRELGLRRIDINPGLFPWKEGTRRDVIAKYDLVIKAAHAAGLQIVLNPQYSPTYHRVSSLEEWSNAALPVYVEL